jgi:hypothetical protein
MENSRIKRLQTVHWIVNTTTPVFEVPDDRLMTRRVVFYFSMGSEDMRQVSKWLIRLNESLSGRSFKNLGWRGGLKFSKGKPITIGI